MIELEVKAVVPDAEALRSALRRAGAREDFAGRLIDKRFDFADGSLTLRDEVVRVRQYHSADGEMKCSLEWKGPTSSVQGLKQREEVGTSCGDSDTMVDILNRIGLKVTRVIDRDIRQFTLEGATVRLEQYARMDDLVEVEGEPDAIERAIARMGIPRDHFNTDRLVEFVQRYEMRTGQRADTGNGSAHA